MGYTAADSVVEEKKRMKQGFCGETVIIVLGLLSVCTFG